MPTGRNPTRVETDTIRRRHHQSGAHPRQPLVHVCLHGRPADESFLAQALIGAVEASRRQHLDLSIVPGGIADRREPGDGLLLAGAMTGAEVAAALATGLPVVCLGRWDCDGPEAVAVGNDDAGGAAAAVGHLRAAGHRRIALLAGPDSARHWRDRRAGWRQAQGADHDLALDWTTTEESPSGAAAALQAAWQAGARATAVFAANDPLAAGVYRAAEALRLRIPQDLSVVGFDDIETAARLTPPLTTMQVAKQALGMAAIEALARLLAGERVESRRLPVRLVPRASVGPPPR